MEVNSAEHDNDDGNDNDDGEPHDSTHSQGCCGDNGVIRPRTSCLQTRG